MSIFPTKHAITFVTDEGIEGLVHMGIDTVELNGEGFTVYVEEGQHVDENTLLAEMNVDFIKEQSKEIDIITIFTNLEDNNKLVISPLGSVKKSDLLGYISL